MKSIIQNLNRHGGLTFQMIQKETNRRPVKRKNKEELENVVAEFYIEKKLSGRQKRRHLKDPL